MRVQIFSCVYVHVYVHVCMSRKRIFISKYLHVCVMCVGVTPVCFFEKERQIRAPSEGKNGKKANIQIRMQLCWPHTSAHISTRQHTWNTIAQIKKSHTSDTYVCVSNQHTSHITHTCPLLHTSHSTHLSVMMT